MYLILMSCRKKNVIAFNLKNYSISRGSEETRDSRFSRVSTQITPSQASELYSFSVKAVTLVKQIFQVNKSMFSGIYYTLNHILGLVLCPSALRPSGFLILF